MRVHNVVIGQENEGHHVIVHTKYPSESFGLLVLYSLVPSKAPEVAIRLVSQLVHHHFYLQIGPQLFIQKASPFCKHSSLEMLQSQQPLSPVHTPPR